MEQQAPNYLALIKHNFDDRDIDGLVEAFRDPARRKEFFREYKETEMLYEIISPDKFLRPSLDDYATLFAESDDLDQVTTLVDDLFTLLEKADRI